MKVYDETIAPTERSWRIKLRDMAHGVSLEAVDFETGNLIADLLLFSDDGKIERLKSAEAALKDDGYDPYKYNNKFDKSGRIIIE